MSPFDKPLLDHPIGPLVHIVNIVFGDENSSEDISVLFSRMALKYNLPKTFLTELYILKDAVLSVIKTYVSPWIFPRRDTLTDVLSLDLVFWSNVCLNKKVVFCPCDVAGLAKVVTKFATESEQQDGKGIKIKGGIVEGAVLDAAGIRKVSTLPPRQELLAQLVASLESPISGLVGALQGVINEFVYTLQAVADKKAEAQ